MGAGVPPRKPKSETQPLQDYDHGTAPPKRKSDSTMVIDNSNAAPDAKDFDATVGKWVPPEEHSRNADKKAPQDPTLTDMLLRDVASGKVRRARAGARRMTFGGSFNPYDTPLGG